MSSNHRQRAGNRLLDALPDGGLRQVLARCEKVELVFADVLCIPGEGFGHVYFPTTAFVSLIMPVEESGSLEVGLVGSEGMVGTTLALGVEASPVRAVVQGAGSTWRMDAMDFRREIGRSQALRQQVDRYIAVQMKQLAQMAACTRFHVVEARLARWLLMAQDRVHANAFHITQEFMATTLGVRRVGVTNAAGSLQRRGLIRYSRGNITVLDRRGLKAASCGCYKADRESYDRIFAASP